MERENRKAVWCSVCLLAAFVLWTTAVSMVDVQPIGPEGSAVGFASLNGKAHALTGVHMALYTMTDVLSLLPLGIMAGFALLGFTQWIGRRSLARVDRSILALGVFYAAVLACYVLFEVLAVNQRPVLIDGKLEASYPSSTTMLVLCVMPTTMMQLKNRMKDSALKRWIIRTMGVFTVSMVCIRWISGVHWLTDIIGGILLSAGLVMLYVPFGRTV